MSRKGLLGNFKIDMICHVDIGDLHEIVVLCMKGCEMCEFILI